MLCVWQCVCTSDSLKTTDAIDGSIPFSTAEVKHDTDTSSLWSQLWTPQPLWVQSANDGSRPTHRTLSNQIGPLPGPYRVPITTPPFLKDYKQLNLNCVHRLHRASQSSRPTVRYISLQVQNHAVEGLATTRPRAIHFYFVLKANSKARSH